MEGVNITIASSDNHIRDILSLQKRNLPRAISIAEKEQQGFVTCDHDFELLKKMNNPYPHIIATYKDRVVGYTLVMLTDMRNDVDILVPMFDVIDNQVYQGSKLKDVRYVVMGQVCIDKPYRSMGLFPALYEGLKNQMRPHFDYCITEISAENKRSLRAHEKVGFKPLHSYYDEKSSITWELVILNLKNSSHI